MVARGSPTICVRLSVKASNSGDRFSIKAWTAILTPAKIVRAPTAAPIAAPTKEP